MLRELYRHLRKSGMRKCDALGIAKGQEKVVFSGAKIHRHRNNQLLNKKEHKP